MNIRLRASSKCGFSLIEMIGVLAIIGILAGIIVPRVIKATARSKINSTAASYNSLKTTVSDYFSQNGAFPVRAGTGATNGPVTTGRFDADLLAGGFTDALFSCAIGSQTYDSSALTGRTHVRSLTAANNGTVSITATAGGDNFDLDGNTGTADFTTANTVVSLVIPGVATSDAVELNKLIDKDTVDGSTADLKGRCIFSTPSGGATTVYLYVAHH